jgi:hypothetical protein
LRWLRRSDQRERRPLSIHRRLDRRERLSRGRENVFFIANAGPGFCLKLSIFVACPINALPPSSFRHRRDQMAKKRRRKYSRGSGEEVRREMHRYKRGRAKSGRGGKGGKVKSRKQAIAIALSKARKKGKKVPRRSAESILDLRAHH